jgi:hypothetical protein
VGLASGQTGRTIGPPRKAKIRIRRSAPWFGHASGCHCSIFLGRFISHSFPTHTNPTVNLGPNPPPQETPRRLSRVIKFHAVPLGPAKPRLRKPQITFRTKKLVRSALLHSRNSSPWQTHVEAGSRRSWQVGLQSLELFGVQLVHPMHEADNITPERDEIPPSCIRGLGRPGS